MDDYLGMRVRDRITGFEGIVTSQTRYLTACDRVFVEGEVKEGKQEDMYLDVNRIEVRGAGPSIVPPAIRGG
jgi:hypothetical protein